MPGVDAPGTSAIDAERFRRVLGRFPTGVCVVTGVGPDGAPAGLSVNSFASASLEPPLIAFLPAQTSMSWPLIAPSGRFCVNVLAGDQEPLSRRFARRERDKFRGVAWTPAPSGSPVIEGVCAWLDCAVHAVHEAGDHVLVLGRVEALGDGDATPLVFHRGGYRPL